MSAESVLPVVRALLGAIAVDGGPTHEQLNVLKAVVSGCWDRRDIDLDALVPLDAAAAAAAVVDEGERRRLRELMVLLELCRHPLSAAQAERVEEYAAALSQSGPGLALVHDLVSSSIDLAAADYYRFFGEHLDELAEPSLRATHLVTSTEPDLELAGRLRAMADLPAGALGREFVEFHERNGLPLPGDDPSYPAVFVAHDMCHVIGGYEPTGQGEIALGAMQLAMADNDTHWVQFLGNLAVHEAGFMPIDGALVRDAALTRAGATDMLAEAFARGAACTADFTTADHLAMAEWQLADVRAEFGVPPLIAPTS